MKILIQIFLKSLVSLQRARILSVVLSCFVFAVFFIVLLVLGISFFASKYVDYFEGTWKWFNQIITLLLPFLLSVGGWFLLPSLMILISGLFQEKIIERVDKAQYNCLVKPALSSSSLSFLMDFLYTFKFTLWAIFLNLLVLPFYFFSIGFVISFLLNSYLLGREFFEIVSTRYVGTEKSLDLSKKNRSKIYMGGAVITLMSLTPILNLIAPVLGTVWMIHTYHLVGFDQK